MQHLDPALLASAAVHIHHVIWLPDMEAQVSSWHVWGMSDSSMRHSTDLIRAQPVIKNGVCRHVSQGRRLQHATSAQQ